MKTSITGFPRIGEKRELKKVLESFWGGKTTLEDLERVSKNLRLRNWSLQREAGIDLISCNDFSWYDQMLDTIVMINAIPQRFRNISNETDRYFAMARGNRDCVAMEMTKWFNTNYHYIVPELDPNDSYTLNTKKIFKEFKEAKDAGIRPKINIIGPVTFLALSKRADDGNPFDLFEKVLPVYINLMKQISTLDEEVVVQFDEPVFVTDPPPELLKFLDRSYSKLGEVSGNVKIIVSTYFEHACEAIDILVNTPIWGLGLDFVYGSKNLDHLKKIRGKKLIAGVVDGRNIWINNIQKTISMLNKIASKFNRDDMIISSSCSLQFVPYSLADETDLDDEIKSWLSFATEKLEEIRLISKLFFNEDLTDSDVEKIGRNKASIENRDKSPRIHNQAVQDSLKNLTKMERSETFKERIICQRDALGYPNLATTTIGSFPQTAEIRKLRRDFKKSKITLNEYEWGIKKYIDDCIQIQEEIGLDILVHGEPERNDMVEYFGEQLKGFIFTANGWVQSYGSRCVKPPIIYGDVSRPEPMTVRWITYAQEQTNKIVKGMLTGPVTILNWSFVRDDIPRSSVSRQIAVALRDEVNDLQKAGIKIIQVDEAAFKEAYPLRQEDIPHYEDWAVKNFRLVASLARPETQIHTHMCYSEFNDIMPTIEAMDADVISIESARSGNELLQAFKKIGYRQEVGPGVYDIHSPRIAGVSEMVDHIKLLLDVLPDNQLWINPDCGLKTRKWEEVKPNLINMVAAVKQVRESHKR